jgi:hypothetical protein
LRYFYVRTTEVVGALSVLSEGKVSEGTEMKLYVSNKRLTKEQVFSLDRSSLSVCWDGTCLDVALQWSLASDSERLWFVCRVPGGATFDARHALGAFVEGLWEHDVAEFFLMDAQGRYQEFNMSPSGAWWSCGFSSYRTRIEQNVAPREVLIESAIEPGAWDVVFSLPLRELLIPLEDVVGIHVSAISRTPLTRYLSSSPVAGEEPNFHRRECFGAVERVELPSSGVST